MGHVLPAGRGRTGPTMGPDQRAEHPTSVPTALLGVYRTKDEAAEMKAGPDEIASAGEDIRDRSETQEEAFTGFVEPLLQDSESSRDGNRTD